MGVKDKVKKKIIKIVVASLLKIFIPIILIIVVLASVWFIVGGESVKKASAAIRGEEDKINVQKDDSTRSYKIDENIVKNVDDMLTKYAIDRGAIGLTEKLINKFIKAETITMYPDLRYRGQIGTKFKGSDNELQGCVIFKRDDDEQFLEYKSFNSFQYELAKLGCTLKDAEGNSITVDESEIYKDEEDVKNAYESLRTYFTLDEENNLIIPKITMKEVKWEYSEYAKEEKNEDKESFEYSVDYVKIPYQMQIEKYGMPVEFLMSLLMVSQNPGFCEKVADLVIDGLENDDTYDGSHILIEIHDDYDITTTVEKYDYESNFNVQAELKIVPPKEEEETEEVDENEDEDEQEDQEDGEDEEDEEVEEKKLEESTYQVNNSSKNKSIDMNSPFYTQTTVRTTQNVSLCVTGAKTWLMDYKASYERQEGESVTTENEYEGAEGDGGEEVTANGDTEQNPVSTDSTEQNPVGADTTVQDSLEGYVTVQDFHEYKEDIIDDAKNSIRKNIEDNYPSVDSSKVVIEEISSEIKEKKGKEKFNEKITKQKISYVKVESEVKNHEERFLSLLKVDPSTNKFDLEDKSKNTKLIAYEVENGAKYSPEGNILSATEVLFEYIASSEHSQSFEEIMRYLLYLYTGRSYGVQTLNYNEYEPSEYTSVQNIVSSGSNFEYKIWITLKNAGYSDEAIAGAMGNFKQECNFKAYCEEKYDGNSNQKELCEKYIADVDNGVISKEEFINSGTGFGLVQWTYHSRKAAFYDFVKSVNGSIGDEALQIEFLMAELGNPISGSTARNYTGACIMENNSFTDSFDGIHYGPHTLEDWTNAQTPEDAAEAFDCIYESGTGVELRKRYAREIYDKYKNMSTGGMILEKMGENGKSKTGLIIARYQAPSGKVFTTFNQGGGSGGIGGIFQTGCNRAAQISVCSAYYYEQGKSDDYIIQRGKDAPNNTCPGWKTMYDECGLEAWTTWENNEMNPQITPEQIKEVLVKGGYLIFCVKGNKDSFGTADSSSRVLSKYGHAWAGTQHYIAILAYRIIDNGTEEIYVSSSSRCDHKDESTIMTGWHPLDEFSYATYNGREVPNYIKSVTEIYEKSQNASPVYVSTRGKV